ncbi:hypothetical protein LTR22_025753 [Elasticomyces elasticus]|nr:hypothetical protein LTR22_025753 [Elasticomyces elasticus]
MAPRRRETKKDREDRERRERDEARINASQQRLRLASDHLNNVPQELLDQLQRSDSWHVTNLPLYNTDIAEYFRRAQATFPLVYGHLSLGNGWNGEESRRRLKRMLATQSVAEADGWANYQARRRAFDHGEDPQRIRNLQAALPEPADAPSPTPAGPPAATPLSRRRSMLATTPVMPSSAHNVAGDVQDALAGFRSTKQRNQPPAPPRGQTPATPTPLNQGLVAGRSGVPDVAKFEALMTVLDAPPGEAVTLREGFLRRSSAQQLEVLQYLSEQVQQRFNGPQQVRGVEQPGRGVEQQTDAGNRARMQQEASDRQLAQSLQLRQPQPDPRVAGWTETLIQRQLDYEERGPQEEQEPVSLFGMAGRQAALPTRAVGPGRARGIGGLRARGAAGGRGRRGTCSEHWDIYTDANRMEDVRRTTEIGGLETVRALDFQGGRAPTPMDMDTSPLPTEEHIRREGEKAKVKTDEYVRSSPRQSGNSRNSEKEKEKVKTVEYERTPTRPSRFESGSASPPTPFQNDYFDAPETLTTPSRRSPPRTAPRTPAATTSSRPPTAIELAAQHLAPLRNNLRTVYDAVRPPTSLELAHDALDGRPPLARVRQPPTSTVPSYSPSFLQPTTASQLKRRPAVESEEDLRRTLFGGQLPEVKAGQKKRGRPVGSKDAVPRTGHPNPTKGKSKYGDTSKPPPGYGSSTTAWDTASGDQHIRIWKGHWMNGNEQGAPAATRCNECRRRDLDCRFFKDAKKSGACNNCEVNHRVCKGGVRVRNDDPEDHTSSKMPPRRRRDGDDDEAGGGGKEGYRGGNMAGVERTFGTGVMAN